MDIDDLSALLGEDVTAETGADIWVVGGQARLVGEARRLADGLGCYVQVVVGSDSEAATAIAFGADRAHVAAEAVRYLEAQRPEFVLFADTQRDAAAQYAQRVGAGLMTGARALSVEEGTRALLASHAVYGGEYFHDLMVTSAVKVAAVEAGQLAEPYPDAGRSGEVVVAEQSPEAPALRDVGPAGYQPPAWRPLSKARVIVSVGRGVRDEAGVDLARQLAEALGAEMAGDRSALSSGWIDAAHEVGVTGQEVAPELYVAVGILGDTMHNAAVTGARRVIAIHPQANAPIFQVADVAVVAEPKAWLPLVLAALPTKPTTA